MTTRLQTKLAIALKGHLLNPLWHSRAERRSVRGEAVRDAVDRYLDRYSGFISEIRPDSAATALPEEEVRIFSIWFQGEENAPAVVQACWNSIRKNCPQKLVILDAGNILEWIDLPDYVVSKWRNGTMRPAHFADICRLALLSKYGGLWLDATDFVPAPLPQWLWDESFFVYMSGAAQRGWYSYVQNCFIRARRGDFLVSAWLKLVLEYWRREDRPIDYFVHQLLFRKLVRENRFAAEEFGSMPSVLQDFAHEMWFIHGNDPYEPEKWAGMLSGAMFQKTEFKSEMAVKPKPGSNAAHFISAYGGGTACRRLFLFASYSRAGMLGGATENYVRTLSGAGDVILCADCELLAAELEKIGNCTLHAEAERHGEYDFGSYKRDWIWASEHLDLACYDYVYLVNDSVFCTVSDLVPFLRPLEIPGNDFVGMVLNPSSRGPHIQSWFVGFSRKVFSCSWFDGFLRSVAREEDIRNVYVKYETGLSALAMKNGYLPHSMLTISGKGVYNSVRRNSGRGLPFIKKSSFVRHGCSLAAQINSVLRDVPQSVSAPIFEEVGREYGADVLGLCRSTCSLVCMGRRVRYVFSKIFRH